MKLQSVRVGFATNSSSSHSVVVSSSSRGLTFEEIFEKYTGQGHEEFGWENDSFTDFDSIVNYGLLLYFAEEGNEDYKLFESKRTPSTSWAGPYIDHQSAYPPDEIEGRGREGFVNFVNYVTQIETGNDNE